MRHSSGPSKAGGAFARFGHRLAGLAVGMSLGLALTGAAIAPAHAEAGAYITFDAASGEIFARHNADQAWYPASISKLMTVYVVFQLIKQGKLSFNSPVVVSQQAARQPPSKMGFPPGTVLTIDNALKMIMVKSANDIAWAIGESVGGSREGFAALMNQYAQQVGMTESTWNNPNGLPDPRQITTAHDMGLLARALLREFPQYDYYFRLPGIQLGNRVIPNHNHLMDHYPGADGMKTGYICSAGFNVVASATRNGHRMITVVLGAHGARPRAELAAELFNRAFDRVGGSNLFSFGGGTETLETYHPGPEAGQPVRDIKAEICGGKRNTGSDEAIDEAEVAPSSGNHDGRPILPGQQGPRATQVEYLSPRFDIGRPVKVWLGGADPVMGRSAALAQPIPANAPQPAPVAAPIRRAPGAILPMQSSEPQAEAPREEVAPQAPLPIAKRAQKPVPGGNTKITRAFTLFPNGEPGAPLRSSEPLAPAARPDPAINVPIPTARPASPVAETVHKRVLKRPVAARKPAKPTKSAKARKPDPDT